MKKYFAIVLIICLIYPIYMSIETWGLMPKSQESAQTIEERVAEMIAEHEADPEAHTGENESLAAHRQNEVLDHPQQSIVADKQQFSIYDEIGNVTDGYGWDIDTGSITGAGERNFYGSLWTQTEILCYAGMPWSNLDVYPDDPLLYRFFLMMNGAQNSNGTISLSTNATNDYADPNRIEFVKDGTSYYYRIYVSNVKVAEYNMQTGGQLKKYVALYFNKDEQKIDFFINGELAYSYETANWHDLIFGYWTIHMQRTTNISIELQISSWGTRYTAF
jgi:hypothetical protein